MSLLSSVIFVLSVSMSVAPLGLVQEVDLGTVQGTDLETDALAVPGEFLVRSDPGDANLAGLANAGSVGAGWSKITVSPEGDARDQARELSERTGLVVEPNYLYQLSVEPIFEDQWGMENTGQTGGTPDADIDIVDAWKTSTGDGVVVAILDSGATIGHVDLAPSTWTNPGETASNGIDDDANGYVDDVYGWDMIGNDANVTDDDFEYTGGHGTFVTGIAVGAINDVGIAGVAPSAQFMSLRVCSLFGCPSDEIIAGIEYAVDNGADVINMSFGGPEGLSLGDAVNKAISAGVTVVAAAGNELVNNDFFPSYPANYSTPGVISVGATNDTDRLAFFSNYGPSTVDVMAPGTDIVGAGVEGGWLIGEGTSFSAPMVAGVVALIKSTVPDASPAFIEDLLISTSDPIPALDGYSVSDGRVNAGAALSSLRFVDISGSVFYDSILWMEEAGITAGCNPPTNDRFCPNDVVTRGQMAAFLVRALGYTDAGAGDLFSDDNDSVFEFDIDKLGTAGVTLGCNPPDNDLYCPSRQVTRGQMAAFLVRALGYTDDGGGNLFVDDNLSIFQSDIDKLGTAGVTVGCNPPANDRFCPDDVVTRGQMAAFLQRALDK